MSYRTRTLLWQRYALVGTLVFQPTAWAELSGGMATDGTMGTAQILSGVSVTVPQSLGTTVGNNLFHSFSEFNIAPGQSVEFTGSNALQNVISRVTGTDRTDIDGTLKSSIANAAFYLINPNGITFGAGAQVDVPGAFHVSTADKIDFPNHSGAFYADSNRASTLSSEAPAAFGFLDTSSVNNGLIQIKGAHLLARQGQTLDMVAGGITVENSEPALATSGQVRLVAMQGAGLVGLVQTNDGILPLPVTEPSASNGGPITVNASIIETSGNGGGRIALWGGNASFKDSVVQAYNTGSTNAVSVKGLDIHSYSLRMDNSFLIFDALGTGNAGNVIVKTGIFDIFNGGVVRSSTFAQGNAGNVTVMADTLKIDNQGEAKVTGIVSRAETRSTGQAGSITIKVGSFEILNGGLVSSSTFAQGNAGSVTVTADSLKIDDRANSPVRTGIFSRAEEGSGHGGNLAIKAGTLDILNGGVISSSTFTQGDAGNITVAADSLTIDTQGGPSNSATGIISRANGGSSGQAGNVSVEAEALNILNGGVVSSDTFAEGNAGNIMINTGTVGVAGKNYNGDESYISSASWGGSSSGRTGDVTVSARNWLHLASGGHISIENEANLPATTAMLVNPGSIVVTAPDIDMKDSEITTNSTHNVAAGNIVLNFSHWLTMEPSFISTTANAGNGGSITINGGEAIYLENSGFRTTVSGANSNGGDITTKADTLVMNTGLIQANAVGGSGGNINLNLNTLIPGGSTLLLRGSTIAWRPFISGLNVIQAASQAGVSGEVNVTAPQLNLSGVIANLGGPQFDTGMVSQDYCGLGTGSSLTRTGAGGLKPKSGDQLLF